MPLLDIIIPPWAKYAAVVGLLAFIFGSGYYVRDYMADAEETKYQLKISSLRSELQKAQTDVRIEYITKIKKVYINGDTTTGQTPQWVDKTIMVNNGFIEHHNAAALNNVLGEPGPNTMQLSSISLTDAEKVISENYRDCNADKETIKSLQESIRTHNKNLKK